MADLVVGETYRVAFVCQNGPQYSQNVRNFRVSFIANGPATELGLANAISAGIAGSYRDILATTCFYQGLKMQKVQPILGMPAISVVGAGGGTVLGDALPPQVAGLLRYTSNTPGRRGRGRVFLPFMGESFNGPSGLPTAPAITAMDALGEKMNGTETFVIGASTVDIEYGRPHSLSGVWIPWLITEPAPGWATQRRRSFLNRADGNPLL